MKNPDWFTDEQTIKISQAFNHSHALLINGERGIGKTYLSQIIAKKILTDQGSLSAENLFKAGTLPDLHVLTSANAYHQLDPLLKPFALRYLDPQSLEKKRLSRQIGVDTVRKLIESMSSSSSSGGTKLAMIYPAENLNINSANALLKFLEEPTSETGLILISHDISRLPATIRSRCMLVNISPPKPDLAQNWLSEQHPEVDKKNLKHALDLAYGRPVIAHHYIRDQQLQLAIQLNVDLLGLFTDRDTNIVALSKNWVKHKQTEFILSWLGQYFSRLIKLKHKIENNDNPHSTMNRLVKVIESIPDQALFNTYDHIIQTKHFYDAVIDETLMIEELVLTIKNTVRH